MAQDKVFNIQIGGVKESITNLESLESVLASLESKVKNINDKGGFSVANKESAKAMDELGKLTQKITQYDEEYQRAVEASKGVLKDKNNEVKQAIELEKANLVIEEGAKSTYNEKQQLLGALGKQIKSMSTDTEENKQKQQELIAQYAALNQELKDFDASLGNHQRNVGDYGQATKNLKQELKELQAEMATMLTDGVDKADPKFVALAQKAGEMKDAINDAGEEIKRFASDTKALDGVINLAQSATAAFQLYKGAMSAFGVETEAAEEAIQKLAGAMSIIQSLQTLQETLQTGSATAKAFNLVMKATGAELVTTQLASIKATAAQEGLTVAQKAGTIATKTLSLAIKAIPLMLVIGLVTELVLHWEDLVGWFNKTFPALNKLGGAMNALKAVFVGLGKAIVNWVTNPLKTLANVIQKIFQGDFSGAIQAVTDGIKNQFAGTAKAFKEGYQAQIESGLEDITKKAAAEQAKQTKYELDMLKARKGNQAKYSKEGIALQKKEFEQRKKAAKGNAEELKQIALDEANFTRECEEQKTAATKKSAAERAKANKDAAAAAKKAAQEAAEEEKKRRKEITDVLSAQNAYRVQMLETMLMENKQQQVLAQEQVDLYKSGPIEKYVEALKKLEELQTAGEGTARQIEYTKALASEWTEFCNIMGDEHADMLKQLEPQWDKFVEGLTNAYTSEEVGFEKMVERLKTMSINGVKVTEEQAVKIVTLLEKHYGTVKQYGYDLENASRKTSDTIEKVYHDAFIKTKDDAIAAIEDALKNVQKIDTSKISNPLYRLFNKDEVKKQEEAFKQAWIKIAEVLDANLYNMKNSWQLYLDELKDKYGEDSKEYIEEQRKMYEAFEKYRKLREQAAKNSGGASKTSNMSSENPSNNRVKSPINPKEYTTTEQGDTNWDALWDKEKTLTDNLVANFKLLDEAVLAPAMDTFSMFMDFAIEETAQRLEQVQELHDKALDKVNESADKIKELNDELKDSGNTNLEATKQQLADEQLLYAQRLAEERKLADEEKALKNKQAQQEANARKMELRYQMIMAIANTAQGASKALATWGWPLGAVFAGVMAALGAIQVALIAKQISAIKPVKYAEGGIINAPSHAQGGARIQGTNLEVEGGEMVINKRDTNRYKDVLYKINNNDPSVRYLQGNTNREFADTKIRKYANGGQLNFERADANLQASTSTNKLMSAINDIDMQPIVAVKDIWKAENRLVRVRGLAGHE